MSENKSKGGINVEPPTPDKVKRGKPEEEKKEESKEGMLTPAHKAAAYASKDMPVGSSCSSGWFELKAKGKLPDKRSYQSTVVYDGQLYIYGGEDIKEGRYADLWVLDLEDFFAHEDKELDEKEAEDPDKYHWKQVKTHGEQPGPLAHHRACIINQCMYLFGGIDNHSANNPHFYSLDMNSFKWTKIEASGDAPAPRDDHSICVDGSKMFVFGGFVAGARTNDLHMFDLDANTWTRLYDHRDWDEIEPPSDFPVPRSGQAVGAKNGAVVVFGGRNNFNDMLGDTWEFTVASKTWKRIECENEPIGRSSHTLTVEGNRMILFGGIVDITKEINELHQYDFGSRTWSQIDDNIPHKDGIERSPSPRKPRRDFTKTETKEVAKKEDKKNMTTIQSPSKRQPDKMRDRNFFLPKEIPKGKQKVNAKKREQFDEMRRDLSTPTTENLRNTFVINSSESFDAYYSQMRKRRGDAAKNKESIKAQQKQCMKPTYRPTARDGHSAIAFKGRFILFGGDRHHMAFNDTYAIRL